MYGCRRISETACIRVASRFAGLNIQLMTKDLVGHSRELVTQRHISGRDNVKRSLVYYTDLPSPGFETVDAGGDVGYFSSIVVDKHGSVFIAYYDATHHAIKLASKVPVRNVFDDDDGEPVILSTGTILDRDRLFKRFANSPVPGFPPDFSADQTDSLPRHGANKVVVRNDSLDVTVTLYGPLEHYPPEISQNERGVLQTNMSDEYPIDYAIIDASRSTLRTADNPDVYWDCGEHDGYHRYVESPCVLSKDKTRVYVMITHFSS
jgi:hypothetical protein